MPTKDQRIGLKNPVHRNELDFLKFFLLQSYSVTSGSVESSI